jgi:hypothetical protein
MNAYVKSRTHCYECKSNWLWIKMDKGGFIKVCRRPWWQFWQWYCGAIFKVDFNGSSHLTGRINRL